MANSKNQYSIYKPKGSQRVSRRRRYKVPSKMLGGTVQMDGEGNPVETPRSTLLQNTANNENEEITQDNEDENNTSDNSSPVDNNEKKGFFESVGDIITGATETADKSAKEEFSNIHPDNESSSSPEEENDENNNEDEKDESIQTDMDEKNSELEEEIQRLNEKIQELETDNKNQLQQIDDLHVQLEQEKDNVNDALQKHVDTLSTIAKTPDTSLPDTSLEVNNQSSYFDDADASHDADASPDADVDTSSATDIGSILNEDNDTVEIPVVPNAVPDPITMKHTGGKKNRTRRRK